MCRLPSLVILLAVAAASALAEETSMADTRPHQTPGRVVLSGVERMTWAGGEMCEFASALTRTLGCSGEAVPYHYVMGVTGVAFRFTFGPEHWNPGFYGFEGVSADAHDLIRRAFTAVGYEYHWYARGDRGEDLRRITGSIDRGVAVMLRGHVVDASDWALVLGYDKGGDILLASSPYCSSKAVDGYDAVEDWHAKTREYVILGEKLERPPVRDIYTEALRLAVKLVRTPQVGDRYTGLKAYEVLAATLREEEFPEESERKEDEPGFRYLCILCYNMMLDDHRSAAPFLQDAVEALPECRDELRRAADCYDRSCELRAQLEDILKSDFSPDAQRSILDAGVRERFAQQILEIRDSDAEAIAQIEAALATMGDGPQVDQRIRERAADRLETERLVIRRFTPDDWAEVQKLAGDMASSDAWQYDHGWPTSEDGCKRAAEYLSKNGCYWAVCLKDSDRITGLVSFNNIEDDGRLDFGHLFLREFARNDLDTEAIACALDHAFAALDVDRIVCRNAVDWAVQLAPLKTLGLRMGGQGKASFHKDEDGNPIEFMGCEMEITRDEWLRRKKANTVER
jgi:ribosomal-protein-alanine N-acetyltransferase